MRWAWGTPWARRALQPLTRAAGRVVAEALDRPTVLLLADARGWTFDHHFRQLAPRLEDEFRVEIEYVRDAPRLRPDRYHVAVVCFWGETYLQRFGFDPARVVKLVSSHRWEDDPRYGPCTPAEMAERHLRDCSTIACTSRRLLDLMAPVFPRAFHVRIGFDPARFFRREERSGAMVVGWAGNVRDEVKGYHDVVVPACTGRFDLRTAGGGLSHDEMNEFYNQLDVLLVASRHEGEPATLIEALAAGCFPVCTDVGIVPEVVTDGVNGRVVRERSAEAVRSALAWCEANLAHVRRAGRQNAADALHLRLWDACADDMRRLLHDTIRWASAPRFRNDDVSWDSSLEHLVRFCGVFREHGLRQIHGVTLRGSTSALFRYGDTPAEYAGQDTLARLDNDTIRRLSAGQRFEAREDLVAFLRQSGDDVALHGLYHTDYSKMSAAEQRREMEEGLAILRRLFPGQPIRTFIPPFNRYNDDTVAACAALGLRISAAEGVHLEAELSRLTLRRDTLYRYHHHRFYPESKFDFYALSIDRLGAALGEAVPRLGERPAPDTVPRRLGLLAQPRLEQWRRLRDRVAHRTAEIRLPREAVVAAVERHGAHPWFVHAFDARQYRWDIRIPARYVAAGWPREARVFEVGCGLALNLIWLGERGFVDLHGSDLAPGYIAAARELAARAGVPIELWQDDGLEPRRVPESCDVVMALNWTHLVPGFELGRFLSIYRAALKPGGCLIIDVIDRSYDRLPGNRYHSADRAKPPEQRRPSEYVVRYSTQDVDDVAAEQGFTVLHRLFREQSIPKLVYVLKRPRW